MSSGYTPMAAEAGRAGHPQSSSFFHRLVCKHCGKSSEREIAPEHMGYHAYYHPPHPGPWHAAHSQTPYYTTNVLLVAIVIFLTFFAAKFLYGK